MNSPTIEQSSTVEPTKEKTMSMNLHLEFKFTDRGGRDVFEIFSNEDNKRMEHPLGAIAIPTHAKGMLKAEVNWSDKPEPGAFDKKPEQLELPLDEPNEE